MMATNLSGVVRGDALPPVASIAHEQAQAREHSTGLGRPLKFRCPDCGFCSPVQIHGHRRPLGGRFDPYCKTALVEVPA